MPMLFKKYISTWSVIKRGHPHSMYAQKSPKLDHTLRPCPQSYTFGLTPLYAYVLSITSLNQHQKDFYGFYLWLKTDLLFSKHNNKWQCNSFFCTKKEKFWDFVVQKKFFLRTYATLKPRLSPCTQSHAFGLTPPLPLCAYVLCGSPQNKVDLTSWLLKYVIKS